MCKRLVGGATVCTIDQIKMGFKKRLKKSIEDTMAFLYLKP